MKTDADNCVKELAEWYGKHRREMKVENIRPIAMKYFGEEEELTEFYDYLASDEGKEQFKKQLRMVAWRLGLAGPKPEEPKFVPAFPGALFPLGQLVTTAVVDAKMKEDPKFEAFVRESIARHHRGDWGDLSKEDKEENELSLRRGFRLLSSYERPPMPKIWIITEADRSATTVLFPEEY